MCLINKRYKLAELISRKQMYKFEENNIKILKIKISKKYLQKKFIRCAFFNVSIIFFFLSPLPSPSFPLIIFLL